jgi:outer membrane lipoprotein carrier protein
MKKVLFATAVIFVLSVPIQCMAIKSCESVLRNLSERYGTLPGLSLEYRREVISGSSSGAGEKTIKDIAEGRLYFKPPHFIKLLQLTPREELLITEGKNVWWHIPDKEKVEVYSASFFGKQLNLLSNILQGFSEGYESFDCDASFVEAGTLLTLRPDPPWKDVDHITIEVERPDTIRSISIRNHMGNTTRFVFENMKIVDSFDENFFEFSDPDSVRIEEQGQH